MGRIGKPAGPARDIRGAVGRCPLGGGVNDGVVGSDVVYVDVIDGDDRETTSLLLSEAREYPQRLLSPTDAKREPRTFELAMTRPLGLKSGKGQGSFVRETRRQVIDFYGELVQTLKPWQAKAPKLPEPPVLVPDAPQPEPPPFVAIEEREPGEATTPSEPAVEDSPEQPGLDLWRHGQYADTDGG
jgi:hypothetical protein